MNSFKFFICSVFFTTLAFAEVHEKTLSNGLKIFVIEDHRSPVAVSKVWYRAGSIDEVNGKTGVAHVLEHMMFKGTKTTKPGEFSEIIASAGGKENAFTGADYTCYFQQLEKTKLPLAMKMEADRMQNLVISEEEFNKEIKVVMEERRWRTDDKPTSQVNELSQSISFRTHPYGRPIVGWMNDLENMTYHDAKEWYQDWYAPNNAILVVAGDVKANEVFELANQHFGKINKRNIKVRKPQLEPVQEGTRRAILKAPSKLGYVQMAYHAPALTKDLVTNVTDAYALEVLAGILSSATRLHESLVNEKSLALSASASYAMTTRGGLSLFELYATPAENVTAEEVENALKNEINKIIKDGVTDEELQRIKTGVIAGEVYQKDSVFYQAMLVGQLETICYPHSLMDAYIDNVKKITSQQIQEVAKKYLNDDYLTVVKLDPQPLDPNKIPQGKPHVH